MSLNPWGSNEPASTILSEESWLQGALVAAIAYGVVLALFCQCVYLFFKSDKAIKLHCQTPVHHRRIFRFHALHVLHGLQLEVHAAGIHRRSELPLAGQAPTKPISPLIRWERVICSVSVALRCLNCALFCPSSLQAFLSLTLAIGLALCDDLQGMFYSDVACFDASDSCLHELGWYVRFRNKDTDSSPVSDLQVVATGILYLVQLSAASPFANTNLNWTIPYISISLGLNILITIAIVLRLLLFRRRIASVLGTTHGAQYTSVAAMIVESASLYSIFSILLLVPFALGSPVASVFLQVIGQIQGCATLLIVLRVAAGKAWSLGHEADVLVNAEPIGSNEHLSSCQFSSGWVLHYR